MFWMFTVTGVLFLVASDPRLANPLVGLPQIPHGLRFAELIVSALLIYQGYSWGYSIVTSGIITSDQMLNFTVLTLLVCLILILKLIF